MMPWGLCLFTHKWVSAGPVGRSSCQRSAEPPLCSSCLVLPPPPQLHVSVLLGCSRGISWPVPNPVENVVLHFTVRPTNEESAAVGKMVCYSQVLGGGADVPWGHMGSWVKRQQEPGGKWGQEPSLVSAGRNRWGRMNRPRLG